MKVIVTQEILDSNPVLVEKGVQIGEEIELNEPCDENGDKLSEDAKGDESESKDTIAGPGPGAPPPPPTKP